jgi:hypothetical protein
VDQGGVRASKWLQEDGPNKYLFVPELLQAALCPLK